MYKINIYPYQLVEYTHQTVNVGKYEKANSRHKRRYSHGLHVNRGYNMSSFLGIFSSF
jgi:hypothetical protein